MIQQLRRQLNPILADYRAATVMVRTERQAVKHAEQTVQATTEAQALLQETAQSVQMQVHSRIAGVVTRCLQAIWGDSAYEFRITFERKRGRTEAAISLVRDGNELDPLDGAGGGCCDVVSLSLRLAAIMLARPKLRRLLIADEPLRHLSADRRPAAREMMQTLAKDLGFQLIFATHARELTVGKVIEVG